MKKVLVFGMTENPGGVESVIMTYFRAIDSNEIHFDFLCNSYEKIAYEDEILSKGSKTIHFPARSQSFFKYKKELNKFFQLHASEYDAIWVNVCSLANIDYLKLAKKYNIPKRIIHSHNSQNMDNKLREVLHKHNKKHIQEYATDFWACSNEAAKWFYDDSLMNEVKIIHNAINVSNFKFSDEKRNEIREQLHWQEQYIIGNVGRLHFQKNQDFLLDIFKEYVSLDDAARLVLVGQGEDENKLKEKIQNYYLEDKVQMVGVQSNITAWLSAFDMFLFPSLFEGLSIAALEAQANGLPMIASSDVIAKETKVNENFHFYSLQESASSWAKYLYENKQNLTRLDFGEVKNNFSKAGYDIDLEKDKLIHYFLGNE